MVEVVEESGLSEEASRDGAFVDCQVTPKACRAERMTTKLLLFDAMIAVRGVFKKVRCKSWSGGARAF